MAFKMPDFETYDRTLKTHVRTLWQAKCTINLQTLVCELQTYV